jgi:glycosyltransferase involved in cell wall biosynthesis
VVRSKPAEQRYWEEHVQPRLGPDDEPLEDITHDQKVELLQRGRAFVFPIRWEEPFGLVMIEALACGMPVLATPAPCVAPRRGLLSRKKRENPLSGGFL